MRRSALTTLPFIWLLAAPHAVLAQRGLGDWMTSAFDAQRSSWVRNDVKISLDSLQKPGFELVWKLKIDNSPGQANSIYQPALLDFFIGHRGFRTLGFFGASPNRVVGIETELGRIEWDKPLPASGSAAATPGCPELTSAVTRPTMTAYLPPPTGSGFGRGTPAKSGVGLAHEGAVTLRDAPRPPMPAPAKPGAAALFNPYAPRVQWLYALTGDGKLHSFWVSNGNEPEPAISFIPPNARARGLIAYGNTVYVAVAGGCGVASGIYALDLETKKIAIWKSAGDVAGTAGPAIGPDGTLYVAAGEGELTALAPKTLQPIANYKAGGPKFTSSPVVFAFDGKDLLAVATSDGRLRLLDTASLSTPLDQSPPFGTPGYESGSLTSWQDPAGTRWILAASGREITAWKVMAKNGKPVLERGWTSRELVSPLPPTVVSGVVFALSSGANRDPKLTPVQRAQQSVPAVLYALDPLTGGDIWNSGSAITSFVPGGGLVAGGTRVYVSTADGTNYAFGFPIEH